MKKAKEVRSDEMVKRASENWEREKGKEKAKKQ